MSMIEVEKKFYLSEQERRMLLADASFVAKKELCDIYYDTQHWDLVRKLWWLRFRNGVLELKTFKKRAGSEGMDYFDEWTDEKDIRARLFLQMEGPLEEAFAEAGLHPRLTITSSRSTYRDGSFRIDIDEANCGGYPLKVVEIEVLVQHPEEMERAAKDICAFAARKGLRTDLHVRGKGYEYLYHEYPDVYTAVEQLQGRV